jgi:1-acyl-sn-glycerol-3-phosphate acyltransferase
MTTAEASSPPVKAAAKVDFADKIAVVDTALLRSPITKVMQWLSQVILRPYVQSKFKVVVAYPPNWHELTRRYHSGLVVACNHSSGLDIPLLTAFLPWWRLSYLAKQELFAHPLVRLYYKYTGTIALNREQVDKHTLKSVKQVLVEPGWALTIFPEGTRKGGGMLEKIKSGATLLASRNEAAILPTAIVYNTQSRKAGVAFAPILETAGRKHEAEALNEELLIALRQARQAAEALANR